MQNRNNAGYMSKFSVPWRFSWLKKIYQSYSQETKFQGKKFPGNKFLGKNCRETRSWSIWLNFQPPLMRCQKHAPMSFIHQKNSETLVMTWFEGFCDTLSYIKVKGGITIHTNRWTPCRKSKSTKYCPKPDGSPSRYSHGKKIAIAPFSQGMQAPLAQPNSFLPSQEDLTCRKTT